MSKVWIIAPYSIDYPVDWQRIWECNLRDGFISIGWAALGNVSKLSVEQIAKLHKEKWENSSHKSAVRDAHCLFNFWNNLQVKDTIVARRGRKAIAAVGRVIGKPYYDRRKTRKIFRGPHAYPNHIDIEWDEDIRDLQFNRQVFGMQTLHSIEPSKYAALLQEAKVGATGFLGGSEGDQAYAGGVKKSQINVYERDPKARAACVKHHGFSCKACGMSFAEVYGELGIDYIHVHHVQPVSTLKTKCTIDPTKDLVPVCPNCHAMLHRSNELLTVSELQSLIKKVKKSLLNRQKSL
jgi:predicted HNH restriction endonuclease